MSSNTSCTLGPNTCTYTTVDSVCIYTRAKALTRYAVESFCSAEATLVRLRVYASLEKGSSRLKKYMRKKFRTVIVYSGEVLYTVREEYTLF